MRLGNIIELVHIAPTVAAASSAFAALRSSASAGEEQGIIAVTSVLGMELNSDFEDCESLDDLLSSQRVSPLLKCYALGFRPHEFLGDIERVAGWSAEFLALDDLRPFQRAVQRNAPAQHELLRAYVLAVFGGMCGRLLPKRGRLGMMDRIGNTRVIAGVEANSTPEIGRDLILATSSASLHKIIAHEIGHWVFDAMKANPTEAGFHATESYQKVSEEDVHEFLTEFQLGMQRILETARQRKGCPLRSGDPRGMRSARGVILICTEVEEAAGTYFHLSLTKDAEPIELEDGLRYAVGLLRLLGIAQDESATAFSARGVLHFGFKSEAAQAMSFSNRSQQQFPVDLAAACANLSAAASSWLRAMLHTDRLGRSETDIAVLLGLQKPSMEIYCDRPERVVPDISLVQRIRTATGEEVVSDSPDEILASAIRCADVQLAQWALAHGAAAGVAEADGRPCAIVAGQSLCLVSSEKQLHYVGPSVDDIFGVLSLLHQSGLDINTSTNDEGNYPLATVRHVRALQFHLDRGAHVDHSNRAGETALFATVRFSPIEVVQGLIGAGADVRHRSLSGETALHAAMERDDVEIARLLLEAGADPDSVTAQGDVPLSLVRNPTMAELLVAFHADVDHASLEGETPLMRAACAGSAATLTILLKHGADVDAATFRGLTPLHYATLEWQAHVRTAKIAALLDAGANLEAETGDGRTPLMQAVMGRDPEVVAELIALGANANVRNRQGQTPLMLAVDEQYDDQRDFRTLEIREKMIRMLLGAGANPNTADREGYVALHYAARHFFRLALELLIEGSAGVDSAAQDGTTPLHLAAMFGGEDKIATLAAAGADVNARDGTGNTPLLRVLIELGPERANEKFVEALLLHGASVIAVNGNGETAGSLCKSAPRCPVSQRIKRQLLLAANSGGRR